VRRPEGDVAHTPVDLPGAAIAPSPEPAVAPPAPVAAEPGGACVPSGSVRREPAHPAPAPAPALAPAEHRPEPARPA
jgi:hypothetical protein